jgi:CSLREA domain-containing protein
MPRRRYPYVLPLFLLSLLLIAMSLPGIRGHFFNSLKAKASPAATFTVNSTGDGADINPGDGVCNDGSGSCTLRAAVQETNAASGADIINFNLPANSTITLNTQLGFNGNISIVGPGSSLLTIQRNSAGGTPNFPIFFFVPINGNFDDSVSGLTILNGNATGSSFPSNSGGGIYNNSFSTLTLTDVVISGSTAKNGGGLYNGGTATLTNCKLTGNSSESGGGLSNFGVITVTNSTVSGNSATIGIGGGIQSGGGTLSLTNSTVSGNTCNAQGGGISNSMASATITNSTISGNEATGLFVAGAAAISNFPGSNVLTLSNTTVTANTAGGSGSGGVGGILNGSGSTANVKNSIIAKNISDQLPHDLNGTFTSQGYNLIGEAVGTEGFTNGINGDQVGTTGSPLDPKLAVLADNGGPTKTHALVIGSPAIDGGNSALSTDQRGQPRPLDDPNVVNATGGNGSDIGAYEVASFLEVNTTADADDGLCRPLGTGNGCTLREAINAANAQSGAESIVFAPALTSGGAVTITLLTALPDLASDMSISGPGASLLTVRRSSAGGTPDFHIFAVNSGITVSLSGLTISNGQVTGTNPSVPGGGISNAGDLTVSNCTVSGNSASGGGGGIYNAGTLTVNNCTVSGNTGGGISNNLFGGTPTATINNSVISGNTVNGGVYNNALNATSTLSINGCTISENSSTGMGGGVSNFSGSFTSRANATISNSTISGNTSTGGGGGVGNGAFFGSAASTLSITNSTITENTGSGGGGGIYHITNGQGSTATLIITNATITKNEGGGISVVDPPSTTNTLRLRNTIVAGNTSNGSRIDISGNVSSASSFNLIGVDTNMVGMTNGTNGNQIGSALSPLDPLLGPLQNNGGFTQTVALLPGSPALDSADNCVTEVAHCGDSSIPQLTTDQRGAGFARIVDGPDADATATVDIGAFEAQVSVADIADQTINEDGSLSLPFIVGGTITSVTATSSNTALVPNNPANISISGSGSSRTLSINPAANAFGSSTITVTVNGNNNQTMSDTFVLTVNAVNDAPSFTKGADQTVNENAGAQTVNNWATNISAGPNESGQTLSFIVTNNSNPTLFAVAPAISSTGTLTYTPATGQSGTAEITIALKDNGGTANGGVDTSATQSFNINVLDGGTLALSAATYSVAESGGAASITITRTGGSAGTATVLFTTSDGTATAADYTSVSQTITFNNGDVSKTVNVPITDDLFKEADETVNLTLSNAGGSGQLGAQTTAVLTILDNDPVGGYLRLTSANFNTTESSGSTTITVERVGDTTQAVAVNYATAEDVNVVPCGTVNGIASSRCDFTSALGTLRFAAGETSKSFAVLITQDSYVEGPESLTIILSSPAGGALLATPSTATLTIADDASEPAGNPIDIADAFVRQQYHDFLNREPDADGLAYWSNQITECQQPGATCDPAVRRVNVSAAFFLSIEFQETGYLVERIYKTGYGDADALSALDTYPTQHPIKAPIVKFIEFLADSQQISKDVMVGIGDWQGQLEANKVAFTQDFVTRARFVAAFPTTLTPAEFVDKLFLNAGVTPTAAERSSIIAEFGGAGTSANTTARARALRRVAENPTLNQTETNKAFVLMQYFGYLRRDPNAAPDTDHTGYDFWLHKLDQFNGNYINAEMVRAFISSIEYRQRFAP